MLTLVGYSLLIISTLLWCVLPILPFLDLTGTELAAYSSGVFIAAEITWWACVPLLGREVFDKVKAWARRFWPSKENQG